MKSYIFLFLLLILSTNTIGICITDIGESILESLSRLLVLDPVFSNPADMIRKEGYPSENHYITTEDGYILTVNRIPGRNGSIPVLLQHGFLGSAADWLGAGKNKSLAYILSDNGFDVWLGNSRGNTYSLKHKTLSISDPRFWNFSMDDLGTYDLSAVITYISDLRNTSLFYVSHSMGGPTFAIMAIERPKIAKKVKAMFALAPGVYLYHMKSIVGWISPYWEQFQVILNYYNFNRFLPRNILLDNFAKYICTTSAKNAQVQNNLCADPLFWIGGYDRSQLNYTLLSGIWGRFPAGSSIKVFMQFLQQINVDVFRKFDYGTKINMKVYNSLQPPNYDLSKLEVPVIVFWAKNDWIVNEVDAYRFYNEVPEQMGIYEVSDKKFSHFDFLYAIDAPKLIYSSIVSKMTNFTGYVEKNSRSLLGDLTSVASGFFSNIF